VARGLDASVGPVFSQRVAERTAEYDTGEQKFHDDATAAHGKAREDISGLEQQARDEQVAAQKEAKGEVAKQRGEWRRELDDTEKDFAGKSASAKDDHLKKVEQEKKKGEDLADKHYADAEAKATAERLDAQKKAEQKKREANESSGGFWGWVRKKARQLVDLLKDAINFIYDNLRKAVKFAFDLAKKLALAALDLARRAIVGLIHVFGEVLKGLVSIALAAFPEIAKRINDKIDAAVDKAVSAVNAVAGWLSSAITAVLDFLSSTLDSLLGLIQSIYNGILTVVGMLISGEFQELLTRIGWLIDAARMVPDTFETAALEELLGGDLDQPMSPLELAAAKVPLPGAEGSAPPTRLDPTALPTAPWTEANVGVDRVATGFQLSPELASEATERADPNSGVYELASSSDGTRTMESVVAEATGQTTEVAPEKLPDDGLTPRGRAEIRWTMMKDAIAKWWSDNWGKVIAGAAAAILGFIALNIVTGGAISAAIPAIMGVLGPLFIGLTVMKIAEHVKNYVEKAWNGDIRGGGKALSHALAAGAIELIMYLTFKVGEAAAGGAKAIVKGAVKGAAKLAKGVVSIISKGLKWVLEQGKILFRGLAESGLGRRLAKLKELGEQLLEHLRFSKFRIRVQGAWFALEAYINPWIVIAEGRIDIVKKGTKDARFASDEQIDAIRKGMEPPKGTKLSPGRTGSFDELDKLRVTGDELTPNHIPSGKAVVEAQMEALEKAGQLPKSQAARKKLAQKLYGEAETIMEKDPVHKAGPTWGSKNKPLYPGDAKNLAEATRRDIQASLNIIAGRGELTPQMLGNYMRHYQNLVLKGVIKYSPEIDKMFMEFLKIAKK
jgi:hypothetical protein